MRSVRTTIAISTAVLLLIIAIVGSLWGIDLILNSIFDFGGGGSSQYTIMSTEPSPDGRFVATVYGLMGGGAAGWCGIRTAVNPVTEPLNVELKENAERYDVFQTRCQNRVTAKWEGDRNLVITYENTDGSGTTIHKQATDWNGQIDIRYVDQSPRSRPRASSTSTKN